jgi:hypothetical protein
MPETPKKTPELLKKIAAANLNRAPFMRIGFEDGPSDGNDYNLTIGYPSGGLFGNQGGFYDADLEAILGKQSGKEFVWQETVKGLYDVIGIKSMQALADAGVRIPGGEHIGIKQKPAPFTERV